MGRYVAHRLLATVLTLLATTVVIVGTRELISDERLVAYLLYGYVDPNAWEEILADLEVGQSFPQRYANWVGGALRGDLGTSNWSGWDVRGAIGQSLHTTGPSVLLAVALGLLTALTLAVWSAMRDDRSARHATRLVSVASRAVPDFWLATLAFYPLAVAGALDLRVLAPVWEYHRHPPPLGHLSLWCVALVAGLTFGGTIAQPLRSAIAGVLAQDHVQTARAKGLAERPVLMRHVLRNALPQVLAIAGAGLPALIGSVLMIEIALMAPGAGLALVESIDLLDFPTMRGVLLVIALAAIVTNFAVDVTGAALDPRTRHPTRELRGAAAPQPGSPSTPMM